MQEKEHCAYFMAVLSQDERFQAMTACASVTQHEVVLFERIACCKLGCSKCGTRICQQVMKMYLNMFLVPASIAVQIDQACSVCSRLSYDGEMRPWASRPVGQGAAAWFSTSQACRCGL